MRCSEPYALRLYECQMIRERNEGRCIVGSSSLTNSALETVLEQIRKTLENVLTQK